MTRPPKTHRRSDAKHATPAPWPRTDTGRPRAGAHAVGAVGSGGGGSGSGSGGRTASDFRPRQTRYPYSARVYLGLNLAPLRLVLPLAGVNISATGLLAAFHSHVGGVPGELEELVRLLETDGECQLQLDVPDNDLPIPTVTASLLRISVEDNSLTLGMCFRAYTPELMDLITYLDRAAPSSGGGGRREKS